MPSANAIRPAGQAWPALAALKLCPAGSACHSASSALPARSTRVSVEMPGKAIERGPSAPVLWRAVRASGTVCTVIRSR